MEVSQGRRGTSVEILLPQVCIERLAGAQVGSPQRDTAVRQPADFSGWR